jgi:protein-S-isoprenylcysteine O-methyltransferase Ste14
MTTPSSSTEQGARVRFPPPLVFLVALLAGVAVSYVRGAPVPLDRTIRVVVGALFVVFGVALILGARRHFLRTGQHPAPWRPSPELIFEGPYRFTRNPMYVGMTAITLGLGLELGNLWILAAAPLALVAVHFIAVLPEERYLSEKFGAPYTEYLTRVRRYL